MCLMDCFTGVDALRRLIARGKPVGERPRHDEVVTAKLVECFFATHLFIMVEAEKKV